MTTVWFKLALTLETIQLVLLLAIIALQAYLAILLFRRRIHKTFRAFFAYTVFSIFSQLISVLLRNHYFLYFYSYWSAEVVSVLLTFLALYEVFHWVFRNFYGFRGFRLSFPIMGIFMLVAAGFRILFWPPADAKPIIATIISLEIAVGFLQVGMFALFFLLVKFFHMRWRQHAFGIALGFGIAASGDLAVFLLRSEIGTKFNSFVLMTYPIAYIIAVGVWLAAFLPPQPDHPLKDWVPPLTPEEMVTELRQYTRAVKGVLRR